MIVYLTKNVSGTIRRLLSTYNYEVTPGVYVGSYHALLHPRIIDYLKKNISGRQRILVLIRDPKSPEGFEEEYINWTSNRMDFNGLKLYKTERKKAVQENLDD